MNKPLHLKKVILGGLLALFFSTTLGISFYHSNYATLNRLTKIIQKKDVDSFLEIVPTFSDRSKISKKQAKVFLESLDKKDINEIEDLLLNEKLFFEKGRDSLFAQKKFLPEKRYLSIKGTKDETISFLLYNENFNMEDNQVGPLIPGNYSIGIHIQSEAFGLVEKIISENLIQKNREVEVNEENIYLTDDSFHSLLLENLVNFYDSMNQGINNNFNFSTLQFTSKETVQQIQTEFVELKDYLDSYKQIFSKVIINLDSLKIDYVSTYMVTFDCFIDLQKIVKFSKDTGIREPIIVDSNNAIVQMIYDDERKRWIVDSVDFETLMQSPEDWDNKKTISLNSKNVGFWTSDGNGTTI